MAVTPYELRLSLLTMAKELLMEEYYTKRDKIISTWERECAYATQFGNKPAQYPDLPTFPTEEEIIKKASALNNFVSKNTV